MNCIYCINFRLDLILEVTDKLTEVKPLESVLEGGELRGRGDQAEGHQGQESSHGGGLCANEAHIT